MYISPLTVDVLLVGAGEADLPALGLKAYWTG